MNARSLKWTAALVVSVSLHAGAAGFVMLRAPQVEIAGGGTTEIAIAGDAFADQVAAGEATEEVLPVTEEAPVQVQPEIAPVVTAETAVETAVPEQPVSEVEPTAEAAEAEQPETAEAAAEPVEPAEEIAAVAEIPLPSPRPH
ncbi:energy transducer TonB, partial [Nitratireductor sp. ZSWI3]|nr:energy transducer TonB [Nitratireductor sp. ZSWI3]